MDWGQWIQPAVIIGFLGWMIYGLRRQISIQNDTLKAMEARLSETDKIIQLYKNATLDLPRMMEVMRDGIKAALNEFKTLTIAGEPKLETSETIKKIIDDLELMEDAFEDWARSRSESEIDLIKKHRKRKVK